jgi:hypothetical protein
LLPYLNLAEFEENILRKAFIEILYTLIRKTNPKKSLPNGQKI